MPHPWKHSRPGWTGSEQPDPVGDVPARCPGLDWVALNSPFPPKAFCDSVAPSLPAEPPQLPRGGGASWRHLLGLWVRCWDLAGWEYIASLGRGSSCWFPFLGELVEPFIVSCFTQCFQEVYK